MAGKTKKSQDKSYDKPATQPPQDLESRLAGVLKEVDELDKAGARNADWYFIAQLLGIALRYVKARTSN